MKPSRIFRQCAAIIGLILLSFTAIAHTDTSKHAHYADLNYDVVYVRCPRGNPVVRPDGSGAISENWNGVNDLWLAVSNNIHQQPGCDLVLHHSDPSYGGGLAAGDPGREEVLVNCDEDTSDPDAPVCSIADPNVSLDGSKIIYTKFTDTRSVVSNTGLVGDAGIGYTRHGQSMMKLDTAASNYGRYATRWPTRIKPYSAPALIFEYDLTTGSETQVSPAPEFFAGRAYPNKSTEWTGNIPVMDTGPFYLPDGRIGFTSNRNDGFYRFQLFNMDENGDNLEFIGHRGVVQQLHPAILQDGRIMYTNADKYFNHGTNNANSLFTINPDGSDPFIFIGENEATRFSYHYATQLSDGDVVVAVYYDGNNFGLGTLRRFPVDPPGPDFINLSNGQPFDATVWKMGGSILPFARVGEYTLTPAASAGDVQMGKYSAVEDYWLHPGRSDEGRVVTIDGVDYSVDRSQINMRGKFSHPSGAPDNDLLVTYTIGGSSTMHHAAFSSSMDETMEVVGKDAGLWLVPLAVSGDEQVGHIADDARIVVDRPEYHEIMPRAVVPYSAIHGMETPDNKPVVANNGQQDDRLAAGEPFALTGAASLIDRETAGLNGIPWNMKDGGGTMSGRTYLSLAAQGGDLAIYDDDEIWGIRVSLLIPQLPQMAYGGREDWAGIQNHHIRILGEYPVRKDEGFLDNQGNPDTSFMAKIPADTPFFFQAIDKRGMALTLEHTSRTAIRGEQQLCGGCHVHTRTAQDPYTSNAKLDTDFLADFSGDSAPLIDVATDGVTPVVRRADEIYTEATAPGVTSRRSFGVDWVNGIADILEARCASCHGEGEGAEVLTGLRLDGNYRTYDLLIKNNYVREDGVKIGPNTLPGDGLTDIDAPGTDRITRRYSCCTPSRWVSLNSARSSMLVWALYGERLDGRDPTTGLPPEGSGILVDSFGREHPEIWPKVAEHAAYVADMPESEKRMLARWVDIGAPLRDVHNDLVRPVLTITPEKEDGAVYRVLVGVWDDSAIDYSKFMVTMNGVNITPSINGTPDVIAVPLPTTITDDNADSVEIKFELWDDPNRDYSWRSPGTEAANRTVKTYTGRGLIKMLDNAAPLSASASIETIMNTKSDGVLPIVNDPDPGDSHVFSIQTVPQNGSVEVVDNYLFYTPNTDFQGTDSFTFSATDPGGLSVIGVADVEVLPPPNSAPRSASALIITELNTASDPVAATVVDPNPEDTHTIDVASTPANGFVEMFDNQLIYTPRLGFTGSDEFTFIATDEGGLSVIGVATVEVGTPGH